MDDKNYVVFHIQKGGIKNPTELSHKLSHNLRTKDSYSNPDIDVDLIKLDVELVSKDGMNRFYEIVEPYRLEYEKRQEKTTGPKRTFKDLLNNKQSAIADEIIFSSSNKFFYDLTEEQTLDYFNSCLNFAKNDMGIKEELIISANIHYDEKSPHLHLIYSPLVKKYNKKIGDEVYTLSKTEYTNKYKGYLSELHDKLADKLQNDGFDISRGITPNNLEEKIEHLDHREWKKKQKLKELEKEIQNKSNPSIIGAPVDEMYETISTRNKYNGTPFITLEDQEELKENMWDLRSFIKSLKHIFENLIEFFRFRLQKGTETQKDDTVTTLTYLHCQNVYNDDDLRYISTDSTKEDEINDYLDEMNNDEYEKEDDGFEL